MKVLIVNENAIMVEGYKYILSESDWRNMITIESTTCKSAENICVYDLVILNITAPVTDLENVLNCNAMRKVSKELRPFKLLVTTSRLDVFTLYDVMKKVNPDGLVVKAELNPKDFLIAVQSIIEGGSFQSKHVRNSMKILYKSAIFLDDVNRNIVVLLARGIQTKSLPQFLNLSISAIDKRKVLIKELFNIEKGTDEDILREAKRLGFI